MAQQFTTTPTSPNPYVSKRLNNIEEANLFKKKCNDWTKIYHKLLQGIETIINVQKQVQNIIKLVEKTNTTIMEMKETILKASNNHQTLNAVNIFSISKDLWNLVQSDIENKTYQVQNKMLTDFSLTWPTLIQDKLDNLEKHMKFVHSPAKTKTFTLPLHYESIWPKGE